MDFNDVFNVGESCWIQQFAKRGRFNFAIRREDKNEMELVKMVEEIEEKRVLINHLYWCSSINEETSIKLFDRATERALLFPSQRIILFSLIYIPIDISLKSITRCVLNSSDNKKKIDFSQRSIPFDRVIQL